MLGYSKRINSLMRRVRDSRRVDIDDPGTKDIRPITKLLDETAASRK